MWPILIAGAINLLSSCNFFYPPTITAGTDTVVLYKKDSLFTANKFPFIIRCVIEHEELKLFSNNKQTKLLIENPLFSLMPEGVYELYISAKEPEEAKLIPLNDGFVTTLDFYSLTAPEAKKIIEADITKQANTILQQKNSEGQLYITIQFGPVKKPDGSYSAKTGSFAFSGIKILQANK